VEPARHIVVTLNSAGVLATVQRAIRETVDVVTFCLNAVEQGNLSAWPETETMRFVLRFADEVSAEQRKAAYMHWLLSKGFQDLARGVRQMLEEAFFYNGMVARAGELHTWAELQAAEQELRKEANEMWFSDLFAAVNKRLTTPLHYEREFLSLQKVRNCLEHRDSIVQERDLGPDSRVLRLRLPRLKLYYEDAGQEIELGIGAVVEKDVEVLTKVVITEHEFKLGERVTFQADEFHDIGFGCWAITDDLVRRLPQLPSKGGDVARSADDVGANERPADET
jgi:hypothetical protein